jgi:KDO2-lipid IV(A) lauroyltransferase
MKDRLRLWRWRLVVPLLRALAGGAASLPRRWLLAGGRAVGLLAWLASRRERERAAAHLALALPGLPAEHRRTCARGAFNHLGTGLLETLAMHRWSREYLLSLLVNPQGLTDLLARTRDGRGAVFVTGHTGNWEMLAALYVRLGGRLHVVGRRMAEPEFDSYLTALRGASGVEVLDRDLSPRRMLRALREGICLGVLPDQDITEVDGIFVDFFGRPAHTPVAPARLCLSAGAPLYVVVLAREGERFRLEVAGPWQARPPADAADREAEVRRLTECWSAALERFIRRRPEQWVWMHRRWRNTPERLARRRGAAAVRTPAPAE